MKSSAYLLFWISLAALLLACGDEASDSEEQTAPMPTRPIVLVLQTEALPQQNGDWVLEADSVNREERQAGLVITADYVHQENGTRAGLTLTAYTTYEEAQQIFAERLAAWQADPTHTVRAISALADQSYTLNDTQSAVALVDGNGIAQVEIAQPSPISDLDLLALLQVGINVMRERELPSLASGGTMGNATLAPPAP
jgi:hypothetical protein